MPERYDEHYVLAVVRMGDRRHVYANQAIFTTNRIKLVDRGMKVDSALYERLVSHKLIPRIDECLSVEGAVTQTTLQEYARDLLKNDPVFAVIQKEKRAREKILRAIEDIPLMPPLAFKLTLAGDQRPEVYDHSMRIALIALFLAIKSYFFTQKDLVTFAAAAIFHDLGILHVPPELIREGRRLAKSERHYLYTHPITACMLLKEFSAYHPEISRTVFEHHERLDGSGYPRGLKSDEICLGAQILMLAEVASPVFEHGAKAQTAVKLSILLRLNQRKFNEDLSARLIAILQSMATGPGGPEGARTTGAGVAAFERKLSDVELVLQNWHTTRCAFPEPGGEKAQPLVAIIDERIRGLKHSLQFAGVDLEDTSVVTGIGRADQEALRELSLVVTETHWQLSEIVYEAQRRLGDAACWETDPQPVLDWLTSSEQVLAIH